MTPDGPVLVIGGGNSGTQIATELAENREVTIAISHPFKFLPLEGVTNPQPLQIRIYRESIPFLFLY